MTALATQFLVDRFGQAQDIVLGCIVGGQKRSGHEACRGRDIEDHAAVTIDKIAQEQLREDMECADIDVDHIQLGVEIGQRKFTRQAKAGIIDQHINTVSFGHLIQLATAISVADIGHDDTNIHTLQFISEFIQAIFSASDKDQIPALVRKISRHISSDTGRCTGDQCFHHSTSNRLLISFFALSMIPSTSAPKISKPSALM